MEPWEVLTKRNRWEVYTNGTGEKCLQNGTVRSVNKTEPWEMYTHDCIINYPSTNYSLFKPADNACICFYVLSMPLFVYN